jgi:phosphohistidine phosphatase
MSVLQLYLLRHANADTEAPTDAERPLSDKGVAQAKRIGRFCREMEIVPDLILTSPLVRTRQTAKHVRAELPNARCEVAQFLASGMHPETAVEELKRYQTLAGIMLVGHEPDISLLIARLVGFPDNANIHIRKGSLTSLQVTDWRTGASVLDFSIPCQLM